MELEHTDLGSHCEVEECNQRDFLPFTCDVCNKKLCLAHRTYIAHNCVGAGAKDMTSIECPICLKTVKFARSDNVDAVWNDHYLNSCSGEPAKKQIEVCSKPSCTINLGPSNKYECKNCRQNVCMSHRRPEDHDCKGMRGAILSKLPPSVSSSSSSQPPLAKKQTQAAKPATASGSSSITTANKTPQGTSSLFGCPFCGLESQSGALLERHITDAHPENPMQSQTGAARANNSPAPVVRAAAPANPNLGREVCPICQARFVDPIDLVTHFEQVHPSSNGTSTSGSSGNSDCNIC
jgi:predicted nucleic acid binding AN1-type Zn finger protein